MAVKVITKENFENEVLNSEKPVMIDFWASWCMPCKMLSPTVDEVAEEQNEVKICKVNVDENPELAKKFRVMGIPTLVLIKDSKEINRLVGVNPKASIMEMIAQ